MFFFRFSVQEKSTVRGEGHGTSKDALFISYGVICLLVIVLVVLFKKLLYLNSKTSPRNLDRTLEVQIEDSLNTERSLVTRSDRFLFKEDNILDTIEVDSGIQNGETKKMTTKFDKDKVFLPTSKFYKYQKEHEKKGKNLRM